MYVYFHSSTVPTFAEDQPWAGVFTLKMEMCTPTGHLCKKNLKDQRVAQGHGVSIQNQVHDKSRSLCPAVEPSLFPITESKNLLKGYVLIHCMQSKPN